MNTARLALAAVFAVACGQAHAARDAASAAVPGYVAPVDIYQRDPRLPKAEAASFAAKVDAIFKRALATSALASPKGFSINRQVIVAPPPVGMPSWTPSIAQGTMLLRAIELSDSKQAPDGTYRGVGEGPTLQLTVNDETALFYNASAENFLSMPNSLGVDRGFPVLEFKSRKHIVIAKQGSAPYRNVSKEEWLRHEIADIKASIAKFEGEPVPQLDARVRELEAELADFTPAERQSPACMSSSRRKGTFADCDEPGADFIVKVNPDYFDRNLPKTAIQLITISTPNHARDDDKMLAPIVRAAVEAMDLTELQRSLE